MTAKVIFWLVIACAVFFALQGGEYSTRDLWRQRQLKVRLSTQVDSLQRQVDSLQREAKAVQTDRATQERIAREQFGMVKGDREILYRFGEPKDSSPSR